MAQWRYKLNSDYRYRSPLLIGVYFHNDWVSIEDGEICIKEQYAWDGCTPSYCLYEGEIGISMAFGSVSGTVLFALMENR